MHVLIAMCCCCFCISVSLQSLDIDADKDLSDRESISSSEETSGNYSDLLSESDVEIRGITTDATVTPTTNDTTNCTSQYCVDYNEAFQPLNKIIVQTLCL